MSVIGIASRLNGEHDVALSVKSLDTLAAQAARYLDTSMRTAGGVLDSLVGLSRQGEPILMLVPEGTAAQDLGMEAIEVPGPFRDFQPAIREAFRARDIQAAVLWGEAWTFPPGDEEAMSRHVKEGLMPSEHPGRQEIVFLSVHWPLGGVGWMSCWRIVRAPTGAYLRPLFERAGQADASSPITVLSSWVDDVLPQPRPGD